MILEMYIDNILIDKEEPNFIFADTVKKRDEVIEDLKAFMYKQNFDKAFISRKNPVFVLVAESRVGELIQSGLRKNDLRAELMRELNDEQKVEKALRRL